MEHVRTQIPYALVVGGVAIVFGTLPVAFGMPWWLGLLIGGVLLYTILRVAGKTPPQLPG